MQSDLQDFLKLAPPELVDVPGLLSSRKEWLSDDGEDAFRSSLRSSETWSDEDVMMA